MRSIRPSRELVATLKLDAERRSALLAAALAGETADLEELSVLEAERASFHALCIGYSPVDPIVSGYQWGEELSNKACPALKARVRENASLEIEGELYDLVAATRLVAEKSQSTARLADWEGKSGRLGLLAGFEYQLPGQDDVPSETIAEPEEIPVAEKEIPLGSNYDLFA